MEYLIINAAECEPLLKTDHFVMRNHAVETIKAIEMVKSQVGAEFAVIATNGITQKKLRLCGQQLQN